MSKEYVLAVVCIFLLCISADYFFNISISLAAVSRTILKSLAGYFILNLLLGKGWFLLLKMKYPTNDFTIVFTVDVSFRFIQR